MSSTDKKDKEIVQSNGPETIPSISSSNEESNIIKSDVGEIPLIQETTQPNKDESSEPPVIIAGDSDKTIEPKVQYCLSGNINESLPDWICNPFLELETKLQMPIWVFIQNDTDDIDKSIFKFFYSQRSLMCGKKVALIIDSPGGNADYAFKIARLFQRRFESFVTIVPSYAKSAATLLALSGDDLILGLDAELGPLDVQVLDREKEDYGSALDAVQALERLSAFSLNAVDQTMQMLLPRTRKKIDTLLPHVLKYAASLAYPLLRKIDSVDYTRKSRNLKIAEEYATRLMKPKYGENKARSIARSLVEKYPTHSFVVDGDEAGGIGIAINTKNMDLDPVTDLVCQLEDKKISLYGLFCKKPNVSKDSEKCCVRKS